MAAVWRGKAGMVWWGGENRVPKTGPNVHGDALLRCSAATVVVINQRQCRRAYLISSRPTTDPCRCRSINRRFAYNEAPL